MEMVELILVSVAQLVRQHRIIIYKIITIKKIIIKLIVIVQLTVTTTITTITVTITVTIITIIIQILILLIILNKYTQNIIAHYQPYYNKNINMVQKQ